MRTSIVSAIIILLLLSVSNILLSSAMQPLSANENSCSITSGKYYSEGNPPDVPVVVQPANMQIDVPTGTTLIVNVSDPENELLSVTFYGRKKLSAADDFTIIGLPDTQYYTGNLNGGSKDMFYNQTQWVVDNMELENIVFVSQLGDCVENADLIEDEWKYADTAMRKIEDPVTTFLDDGIPYGIAVGNHDQTPWGDPDGTTVLYNLYFGEARFAGRTYYGGHYGSNNDNHYQFFSAGGMEFIVINLEYDPSANADVMNWAENLLIAHNDKRAIIVSHYLITTGNPASFGSQGQAIYNKFKDNENVFLMLGGHYPGEGRRSDTFNGSTIHTLLSDYQMREGGGNGWLRIMKFSPANNSISVQTYSPWLDEWETDDDSEFTLNYDMSQAGYQKLGSIENVASGGSASLEWQNLDPSTEYEWYVEVSDGTTVTMGPAWLFKTGSHKLELKVFLEGSYINGSMQTDLSGQIPLYQPYNQQPWLYEGTEIFSTPAADIIDWVLVELRDAPDPNSAYADSRVFRKAALLKTNGNIVTADGEDYLEFSVPVSQNVFAVIWHRNHLPVISSGSLQNDFGVFSYDFTTGSETVLGGVNGYSQLSYEDWGLSAGDANADGIINDLDKESWTFSGGNKGYLAADSNMDQQVNNMDKNDRWIKNIGKSSYVPE